MAISGTQNLQSFLGRVSGTGDSNPKMESLKAENLDIKNVYIGKDNKVHVSNSGFYRWIAEKGGRATGAEAFKQALGQAMKPTLARGGMEHAGERILDNLMGRIGEHQARHASWESRNRFRQAGFGQAPGEEPTKALGELLNEATAEEIPKQQQDDARNSAVAAGKQDAESFIKSCAGDPNPLDKLKARLGIYENQRANAGKAAERPQYEYKENKMQAEKMRSLDPKLEMARLDASISVIASEIIKQHPSLSKIEQQVQDFDGRINDALKDVSLRDVLLDDEKQSAVHDLGSEIHSAIEEWGGETMATMRELGLPEVEIKKFQNMVDTTVDYAATSMRSAPGISWNLESLAQAALGGAEKTTAAKFKALVGHVADFAPKGSPTGTFAYMNVAMKGFMEKLPLCQLTEKELVKLIDEKMPKYADMVARAKNPGDARALAAELYPVMDEDLTSGMTTTQQFKYYSAALFGDTESDYQEKGRLPTADKCTQSDLEALKKVSKDMLAAGQFQLNPPASLKAYIDVKASQ